MEILGYILAIIVGILMGLLGGGGSVLCVPIFTYVFNYNAIESTSFSLFIVGVVSLIGTIFQLKTKNIDFKNVIYFGIPSIISVIIIRKFLVPNLPEFLYSSNVITIRKDMMILIIFALLMIMSAYKMIKPTLPSNTLNSPKSQNQLLIAQGLGIGMITGLIGAGGGFLIVPALVILMGLEIKKAIATSLFIVGLNSSFGFLSSIGLIEIQWSQLLIFLLFSIVGLFIGMVFNKKINTNKLKPLFGWFILLIGTFIIIKEILNEFI